MSFTTSDSYKGQAIYTKFILTIYNLWVLGISNSLIWKCPTKKLLEQYNKYVSDNHLDVGVGTGYYINKCVFPSKDPNITLMDLNSNSLDYSVKVNRHYQPKAIIADVLKPINCKSKYNSISINYLLHCLPGTMEAKGIVFYNLKKLLNEKGVIFGSTILQGDIKQNMLANRLLKLYNRKGIFSNNQDDLISLKKQLEKYFTDIKLIVIGSVAIFSAKN
jgi:hypothetical protein